MTLLGQVAVFLTATVIAVPLFRRLRLSSILGYLAAGVAIGPWGLRVAEDGEAVMHFAEFGVVLLLFVIGLELQPSRLRAMRRTVFGIGLAQTAATSAALGSLAFAFGLPIGAAIVVGFALSLSSTPLVLQLLAERQQLNTHHGRTGFGILLFQDIAVMPMLALLPLLSAEHSSQSLTDSLLSGAQVLALLAAMVFGAPYLLRPLLRSVAQTKVAEARTAAALLVVVGAALLMNAVGLSMALGAFIAGLLLADSEYRHELEADIEPFKGLLLGLFFMSVGMTANLGLLLEAPARIAALTVGLLTVKGAILWIIARLTHHTPAASRSVAFALPQAGEFGFVLFAMAVGHGVLEASVADTLVIVVTLSMMLSPLLMTLHANLIEPRLTSAPARAFDPIEADGSRVIIAGFGRFGQIVARVLSMRRIRFTALDANVAQVDFVRRFGNKVYYGDAGRLELLQAAGAAHAEVLVVAVDDAEASIRIVEVAQKHFPHLKLLARARNRQHAMRLMDLGVSYHIRETYLSSLAIARSTLEALGMPRTDAAESIRRFEAHDSKTLQAQRAAGGDEQKLIQTSQQAAQELEKLFEADQTTEARDVRREERRTL